MMARNQIALDPELQKRARERAAHLGISFAEYIRRLWIDDLVEREQQADPSAVFNLGNSGGSDLARNKDTMVGEAAEAEALGNGLQ